MLRLSRGIPRQEDCGKEIRFEGGWLVSCLLELDYVELCGTQPQPQRSKVGTSCMYQLERYVG